MDEQQVGQMKMVRVANGEAAIGDPVWTANPKNGVVCRWTVSCEGWEPETVLLIGDEIANGEPFLVKRAGIFTSYESALLAAQGERSQEVGHGEG